MDKLTKREIEIMSLLAQGYSDKGIADILIVSEHTIKTHKHQIYKKLNIKSEDKYNQRVLLVNKYIDTLFLRNEQ